MPKAMWCSRWGYVGVLVIRVRRAAGARVSCYQVRHSAVVPHLSRETRIGRINGVGKSVFDLVTSVRVSDARPLMHDQSMGLERITEEPAN